MEPHLPLQDVARRYLDGRIARARAELQPRLETLRQISADTGIPRAAIGRAVAALKHEGVLDVRRKLGIVVKVPPSETAGERPSPMRWLRLRQQILRDLATNTFGHTRPLPIPKDLCHRYAVSYRTLRKALTALVADGMLVPHGRTYRQLPAPSMANRGTVVLFARSRANGLVGFRDWSRECFSTIERECHDRNVQLKVVMCYADVRREVHFTGLDRHALDDKAALPRILGMIVWEANMFREFTHTLLPWLCGFGKPIALYCEEDVPLLGWDKAMTRLLRVYVPRANFAAGQDMGRYLLSLGHRHVCCFTVDEGEAWAEQRIDGLRSAFVEAGLTNAVTCRKLKVLPAWIQRKPTDWTLYAEALNKHTFALLKQKHNIPMRHAGVVELNDTLKQLARQEIVHQKLTGVFRGVLDNSAITAWIGINDVVAIECVRFLGEKGLRMPQRISVVGFDDSIDAAYHRITSYSFSQVSTMHLMMDYVIRPNTPLANARAAEPIVGTGFVHERATTGPAPRAKARAMFPTADC